MRVLTWCILIMISTLERGMDLFFSSRFLVNTSCISRIKVYPTLKFLFYVHIREFHEIQQPIVSSTSKSFYHKGIMWSFCVFLAESIRKLLMLGQLYQKGIKNNHLLTFKQLFQKKGNKLFGKDSWIL